MANEYKEAMKMTELRFVVIPASSSTNTTTFPSSSSRTSDHAPAVAATTTTATTSVHSISSNSPLPPPSTSSRPYEVVLPLETPSLASIDSDEIEGTKLLNAYQAITTYWYARTGSVGAFSAPIYQPPHELTTTLWPPRLMLTAPIDESSVEIIDDRSGNSSDNDPNKSRSGPEHGSKKGLYNPIASWLLAAPVFGDAVLTIMDPDGFGQTTLSTLASCILASFPSDKWCERGSRNLLTMPQYYFEPAWTGDLAPATIEYMKLPITILTEIISRRTTKKSYTKTFIKYIPSSTPTSSSSSTSMHTCLPLEEGHTCNQPSLVPEPTPSGWWDNGIYRPLVGTKESSISTPIEHLVDLTIEDDDTVPEGVTTSHVHPINDSTPLSNPLSTLPNNPLSISPNNNRIINTDPIESDRFFLSITLPKALGLFEASGKEFVSAVPIVGTNITGPEAQEIEQALALRALWAIEEAGKVTIQQNTTLCYIYYFFRAFQFSFL